MPQTSPMNWMTTSLAVIILMNTMSSKELWKTTKNINKEEKKKMKMINWSW